MVQPPSDAQASYSVKHVGGPSEAARAKGPSSAGRPAPRCDGDPGRSGRIFSTSPSGDERHVRGSAVGFLTDTACPSWTVSGSEGTVKTIHHVVDIDATDDVVWRSLTDESALAS